MPTYGGHDGFAALHDKVNSPTLELATQQFLDTLTADTTYNVLPPADAAVAFQRLQALPVGRPGAQIQDLTFPVGPTRSVPIRIVRPNDTDEALPVVLYCHGGGWFCGDVNTHDRLIREIAVGAGAAVVFVSYDLLPNAQFPVQFEQVYACLQHVADHADELNLDAMRLAIMGDGAGGALAAAVTLAVRERRGPKIDLQVLMCPVLGAHCNTESYELFADSPWLARATMQQVWSAYLPDPALREDVVASPLRASIEQLTNLPETLVVVAECDVMRDEGESYARKLSDAGNRVTSARYNGTIHDFVVLNALADTPAARGAMALIIALLTSTFG
ncbi:MAG TPA: alpha/beta hydrolase [Acetobacteraceae bacterium]|jgi:acetyl esterase|nr:alpha/beta hydrolase [Acetobacteraceae bacterium]